MQKFTFPEHAVSVVIPTYNRANVLSKALDGVLQQEWPQLEIVVVDDGSTDDTPNLLKIYAERHPNLLRIIRLPNGGPSQARNEGIEAARYPFVALLDSDNYWLPDKLKRQMKLFRDDAEIGFSFTDYYDVNGNTREPVILDVWKESQEYALEKLLVGCCINTSTVVAKRSILMDVGLFDSSLRCCEDQDLWLRVAAAGHRIAHLAQPLMEYRVEGERLSANQSLVDHSAERVFHKLFRNEIFPTAFQARQRYYLSRCYLNSACGSLQEGSGSLTMRQLRRAFRLHPASLRPGWVLIYARALFNHKP